MANEWGAIETRDEIRWVARTTSRGWQAIGWVHADGRIAMCWCRRRRQYRAKNPVINRPAIRIITSAADRG